jgi:LPXTG-site transpeptidase (sortase) family protein
MFSKHNLFRMPYTSDMRPAIALRLGIYLLAAGLLGWAAYLAWPYWQAKTTGDSLPPPQTINYSTSTPSERSTPKPSDSKVYTVAADKPRAIDIPAIGASGFIQPVGIDRQQHMAAPTNVGFAGWYTRSVPPGQPGLSIINGHVSGRYSAGIFKQLQKLGNGDKIRIQRGDLSWITYRIANKTLFNASDNQVLFKVSTDKAAELHIVTCTGPYNKISQSYEQRLLITAVLTSS